MSNPYQRALEILEERGWKSGAVAFDDDRATCAGGALAEALGLGQDAIYGGAGFKTLKPWCMKLVDHVQPEWREQWSVFGDVSDAAPIALYRWNDRVGEEAVKQGLREMAEKES